MSRYEADPNNSKKQQPKSIPLSGFGKAITPAPTTIVDRPSYILINKVGNYSFAYEDGGMQTNYESGSQLTNAAAGPIRLDINPVAWVSNGGAAGDVTFVYTGNVG